MVFLIRIIPVVVGAVLAATCLVWETILGDWAIFASAVLGGLIALVGILLMFALRQMMLTPSMMTLR